MVTKERWVFNVLGTELSVGIELYVGDRAGSEDRDQLLGTELTMRESLVVRYIAKCEGTELCE